MVTFHSFLYVYQRVTVGNYETLKTMGLAEGIRRPTATGFRNHPQYEILRQESGWLSHEKLHDVPVDAVLVGGFKHFFPFHIWDVIRNPLTNSIIFQDGHIAPPTSQPEYDNAFFNEIMNA